MPTTSPDNISYPSNTDAQKTIEQRIEDTAVSVQSALNTKAASSHVHAAADVTSGVLSTARGGTGTATGAGLTPVIPSSVTVASGSSSVGEKGLVTFTGVTSVSLNTIFTSAYANYRIDTTFTGSSNGAGLYMRLRSGTSDDAGTGYYYAGSWQRNSNTSYLAWTGNGTTYFDIGRCNANSVIIGYVSLDITNPLAATRTNYIMQALVDDNNSAMWISSSGVQVSTTSYNGFTLYPTAGSITGRVQVYGYN